MGGLASLFFLAGGRVVGGHQQPGNSESPDPHHPMLRHRITITNITNIPGVFLAPCCHTDGGRQALVATIRRL